MPTDPQRPEELPPEAMYELRAGTYRPDELHVLSFEGREEMNGLYAYDVLVWGKDLDDDTFETSVLGHPAALSMRVSEESGRWVHGIVSSVVFEGRREAGRCAFRLTVVLQDVAAAQAGEQPDFSGPRRAADHGRDPRRVRRRARVDLALQLPTPSVLRAVPGERLPLRHQDPGRGGIFSSSSSRGTTPTARAPSASPSRMTRTRIR